MVLKTNNISDFRSTTSLKVPNKNRPTPSISNKGTIIFENDTYYGSDGVEWKPFNFSSNPFPSAPKPVVNFQDLGNGGGTVLLNPDTTLVEIDRQNDTEIQLPNNPPLGRRIVICSTGLNDLSITSTEGITPVGFSYTAIDPNTVEIDVSSFNGIFIYARPSSGGNPTWFAFRLN